MTTNDIIPARGRFASLMLEVMGELTTQDLARLDSAQHTDVPPLQRIKAHHHRQAQLLARGLKVSEVAAICGTTPQRITQLQADPSFAELVSYYTDQTIGAMLEDSQRVSAKLVAAGEAAVDEINERLDDDAKRQAMPVGELRKIAELGLDRTVAPPKSTSSQPTRPTNITLNFGTTLKPKSEEKEPLTIDQDSKDENL